MKTPGNLRAATEKYRKTQRGVITNIYHKQIYHCKHRGSPVPTYTLEQLQNKFLNKRTFRRIYLKWRGSNYDMQLKPSIDRIDCLKPYSLENIQVLTWAENRYKQRFELGRIRARAVYCLAGGALVATYKSVTEAVRATGLHQGNISSCLHGARKTCGGYVWSYQNPELLDG